MWSVVNGILILSAPQKLGNDGRLLRVFYRSADARRASNKVFCNSYYIR